MKFVSKVLNSFALTIAETNRNSCAIIGFDEPKMPNSML
jgi:cyclic lactone autoinducer peptide